MENQTNTTPNVLDVQQNLLSKIKGFLSNFKNVHGNKLQQKTSSFVLGSKKNYIVSLSVGLVIVICVCVYAGYVTKKYEDINSSYDTLKNLSAYNLSLNRSVDSYVEGGDNLTVNGTIRVVNNIQDEMLQRTDFKKAQDKYYSILLKNIYLPSLNVWKDLYTKDFDISVLGQKYLEQDKFQDFYLIQYWSDFVKFVGNDADYNSIENISLGERVELEDSDYFYIPVSLSFKSPNKRSFLLLVNKLSVTSNTNNISLLNEFFFYLFMKIKENKSDVINNLMHEYWPVFSSSSGWDGPQNISDLTDEQRNQYQDSIIGYELYNWVNDNLSDRGESRIIDDNIIVETIKENMVCDSTISDAECFYNFRDKYRNLPYLSYKIGMENQTNRTWGLHDFLQDLPPVIVITDFGFEKHSNSNFLNNEQEQYEGTLSFNAYGRAISNEELEEAAMMLGELCFGAATEKKLSSDIALNRVNDMLVLWGGLNESVNVSSLEELQGLFTIINDEYEGLTNYNRMIKLFELWRMLNDANLCS